MDAATIIAAIEAAIKLASLAAQLGKDIAPYAESIYDNLVNGKEVTQEDLDKLALQVDALHEEFQQTLPPDQP